MADDSTAQLVGTIGGACSSALFWVGATLSNDRLLSHLNKRLTHQRSVEQQKWYLDHRFLFYVLALCCSVLYAATSLNSLMIALNDTASDVSNGLIVASYLAMIMCVFWTVLEGVETVKRLRTGQGGGGGIQSGLAGSGGGAAGRNTSGRSKLPGSGAVSRNQIHGSDPHYSTAASSSHHHVSNHELDTTEDVASVDDDGNNERTHGGASAGNDSFTYDDAYASGLDSATSDLNAEPRGDHRDEHRDEGFAPERRTDSQLERYQRKQQQIRSSKQPNRDDDAKNTNNGDGGSDCDCCGSSSGASSSCCAGDCFWHYRAIISVVSVIVLYLAFNVIEIVHKSMTGSYIGIGPWASAAISALFGFACIFQCVHTYRFFSVASKELASRFLTIFALLAFFLITRAVLIFPPVQTQIPPILLPATVFLCDSLSIVVLLSRVPKAK